MTDDGKFYMDGRLKRNLESVKKKVELKDEDYFFAVDGEEGSGKSVFTMQLAKFLDPTFCLERVVFDPEQFKDAVLSAKKRQAIVFDEAFRGLSSRGALTKMNKLLVQLMMECRQKNLFVFIVMPTFFLLDKYVAMHRSKGLFHVYRPTKGKQKGRRGFFRFYNKKKQRLLYLKGKAAYSYVFPKTGFRGRFLEQYAVDEGAYREKKGAALTEGHKKKKEDDHMWQRDLLLWYVHKEKGATLKEVQRRLQELGWKTSTSALYDPIRKVEERLREQGKLL